VRAGCCPCLNYIIVVQRQYRQLHLPNTQSHSH
jgi:hypothetical protein